MDALSRVLDVLRLEPRLIHRLSLATPWGIQMSIQQGATFHVVEQGGCWLKIDTHPAPFWIQQGDLVVISNTLHYELFDSPASATVPLEKLLAMRDKNGLYNPTHRQNAPVTTLICGEFRTQQTTVIPLFSLFPPFILIRGDKGQAVPWLTLPVESITEEVRQGYPGKETVISRLMDILFIMVIRYWIVYQAGEQGGLFKALYHPQIGEVLGLIHRQPEHTWTVETLALAVNMSRSSLAMQFTTMVGESPMKYLTRWRMQLATVLLLDHPQWTIEDIAQRVGYTSSYAFSKAFKRLVGLAPSDYRTQAFRDNPSAAARSFMP